MKIALIGASGRVGLKVVDEALARGHSVTAIARNLDKLPDRPKLTKHRADIYDADAVAKAVAGHEAVISTFNPGWTNPAIRSDTTRGTRSLIAGLKKAGVRRALFVGGAGSLMTVPGKRDVDSPDFPAQWKEGALGAADALEIVRGEKDLDWTFLSPAVVLTPGPKTGKYRLGKDAPVRDAEGKSVVSDGDLASAILDEIETPKHIRQRFTVGY